MKSPARSLVLPLPLIIFLLARLPILLALPFDGLRGYGDLLHFYNLASIPGLPYINFWIEFPPGFAFLNEFIYTMAGGVEHVYTYLFVLLLLAADIGNVILFTRIEKLLYPGEATPTWRSLAYAALIAGLPYAWWYYDPLIVFLALLTLYLVLRQRGSLGVGAALGVGTTLGLGILLKLFPVLLLPALARTQPVKRTAVIAGTALGLFCIPVVALYLISPQFTRATLAAQSSRGSVATVWAIIDGNYRSGGFGPLVERLDPALADVTFRNLPIIPPLLLLVIFGGLGLYLWVRARIRNPEQMLAFYGLTLVLFFLWSNAWSPQWIMHLIPVALLVLPFSPGLLLVITLVLANLLEWPLLLSRGLFYTYPVTILLRLALMLILGGLFYQRVRAPQEQAETQPA